MGHHYIPQRYLKNFQSAEHPGFIWLYDKQGSQPRLANIAKVAQKKQYYSEETEVLLAKEVETPANIVMERLKQHEFINEEERFKLAYYIGTMLKRVPYRRRRAREMVPDVLDDTVTRVRAMILHLEDDGADAALVEEMLQELEKAHDKYAKEPPPYVTEQIRMPWPYLNMLRAIFNMTWRIVETKGPQLFITTDNPAFFFGAYGLGTEESELSFPLSKGYCLHGSWQGSPGDLLFMSANQWFVKEMNRRVASTAERFAFCHEPATWLQKTLQKNSADHYLSVIRW
jgi:hypothetical protein